MAVECLDVQLYSNVSYYEVGVRVGIVAPGKVNLKREEKLSHSEIIAWLQTRGVTVRINAKAPLKAMGVPSKFHCGQFRARFSH
jgi:hypothetical protein